MPVYVVVTSARNQDAGLDSAVEALPGPETNRLKINDGHWLVEHDGTTRDVAVALNIRNPVGITEEAHNPAFIGIVFKIANYSGRAADPVWDWLGSRELARGE